MGYMADTSREEQLSEDAGAVSSEAVDILAIGAHPDDVEIGCAGFLLKAQERGLTTGIVVLTQGEMGTFGDKETRVAEARAAAEILQANTFDMLDMRDAGLEFDRGNMLQVTEILKKRRPRIVLSPHFHDPHPDHEVAAQLVRRAIYLATRPALFPEYEPLYPQPQHLTFSLSFQNVARPDLLLDISNVYHLKQRALQAHGSQYAPALFGVEIAARFYGMMIPAAYGEGFYHEYALRLTDDLRII